jgi:hypothetical protein
VSRCFIANAEPEVEDDANLFLHGCGGSLTAEQKRKITGEITRVHCEVTGAPAFLPGSSSTRRNPAMQSIGK